MSDKINAQHLSRKAYVYVRQSSMEQVRNNLESKRRQYELADKARSMGWTEVEVIDEDVDVGFTGKMLGVDFLAPAVFPPGPPPGC